MRILSIVVCHTWINLLLSERGKFLALDLGGTNFRVLLIELGGDNKAPSKFKMQSKIFAVPQHIMLGHGKGVRANFIKCLPYRPQTRQQSASYNCVVCFVFPQLFDHIAECLATF